MEENSSTDLKQVPIRPAATVILLRDGEQGLETLLLRRNSRLAFAGGAWVFPGGRFEDSDFSLAGSDDEHAAAPFAAARETIEETGLTVDPHQFVYYSHWTTPPVMPKRFATWFFISHLDDEQDVIIDDSEIKDHIWSTPQDALARHARGDIEMMPPTFVSLLELSGLDSAQAVLAHFAAREPRVYEPRFAKLDGVSVALYSGDAGYEGSDAAVPGSRHRCVLAEGAWTYEYQLA